MSFGEQEALRKIERMVIVATVVDLDTAATKARVEIAPGVISNWLSFIQLGSKDVRIWCPPVIGSQVVVLSPGGDTANGLILPGPYEGAAPDNRAASMRVTMPGIDIQMIAGVATVTLTTAHITGDVVIDGALRLTGDFTAQSDIALTGDMVSRGDVTASGVSLVNHTHGGVKAGTNSTGSPN